MWRRRPLVAGGDMIRSMGKCPIQFRCTICGHSVENSGCLCGNLSTVAGFFLARLGADTARPVGRSIRDLTS
jgi:hypothetical protein